jgi:hypothetical protein
MGRANNGQLARVTSTSKSALVSRLIAARAASIRWCSSGVTRPITITNYPTRRRRRSACAGKASSATTTTYEIVTAERVRNQGHDRAEFTCSSSVGILLTPHSEKQQQKTNIQATRSGKRFYNECATSFKNCCTNVDSRDDRARRDRGVNRALRMVLVRDRHAEQRPKRLRVSPFWRARAGAFSFRETSAHGISCCRSTA